MVFDDVVLTGRLTKLFLKLLLQEGPTTTNPLSEAVFLEVELFDQLLFVQKCDVLQSLPFSKSYRN